MKSLKLQAIISSIRAKVDRSIGLSISTPELSPEEVALFFQLQGVNLDLTITPLDEKTTELQEIDKEAKQKTPSQRLRSVLFLIWKKEGEQGFFDDFYKIRMEKIIDAMKAKLE